MRAHIPYFLHFLFCLWKRLEQRLVCLCRVNNDDVNDDSDKPFFMVANVYWHGIVASYNVFYEVYSTSTIILIRPSNYKIIPLELDQYTCSDFILYAWQKSKQPIPTKFCMQMQNPLTRRQSVCYPDINGALQLLFETF